jgi:hypothetical protein
MKNSYAVEEDNLLSQPHNFLGTFFDYGSKTVNSIWSYIVQNTIGDSYQAYMNTEKFLEELHNRSWESGTNVGIGHIGPSWQTMLPKLVYVSGSDKASFQRVAGYGEVMNGEDDEADTAARAPFKVVEKLLGLKVINNLQGDEAMRAKAQMKRHLNTPASLQEVQSYSKETFDQFLAELDSTESFSVSIYRLVVTILCHCVFGIRSELNKAHIPELMQMAHLVTNPWYSNSQIQEAAARLREISAELLQDGSVAIAPDKFIANHAGLTAEMTEEEKVDRLAGENIAGSFLAATNLSDLIMKTMVAISGNRSLKEALVAELTNQETEKLDSLRSVSFIRRRILRSTTFIFTLLNCSPNLKIYHLIDR